VLARRLIPLLAVTGLLIAGCGGSNGNGTGSDTGQPASVRPIHVLGGWKGVLHQAGIAPFTVTVVIASLHDSSANHVDYTGINCGGHWSFLGTAGPAYRFQEVIDQGVGGNCKGVGEVSVTPRPAGNLVSNKLDYAFRGAGVESSGVLHRWGNLDELTSKARK
jgi:hypothetical protein